MAENKITVQGENRKSGAYLGACGACMRVFAMDYLPESN